MLAPVVAAKQYGSEVVLTPLIAEACLNVCPTRGSKRSFNVDNVRVAKLVGGTVSESTVIKGVVVERDTMGMHLEFQFIFSLSLCHSVSLLVMQEYILVKPNIFREQVRLRK